MKRKTKLSILFMVLFIFNISIVHGAQLYSITGHLIDTNTVEITGNGFGTITDLPESLNYNIEEGNVGDAFEKANWRQYYSAKALYSDNDSHSGKKSIIFEFTDSNIGCALMYDFGQHVEKIYITAWIKIVKLDNQTIFQWKNWRIKNSNDYNVAVLGHTGVIGDCWWGANEGIWGNSDLQVYSDGVALQDEKRTLPADAFVFDEWQRIEAYYKKSDTNSKNGKIEWRRIGRSNGEIIISNNDAITHTKPGDDQLWRYTLIGHYYGNTTGGTFRHMKVYYDDIYISQTNARVEIGNNKIWSNCTKREIQVPKKWSDNSIVLELNKGSFASGQYYLYVVDNEGNVNENGFPIQLSTGQGEILYSPNNLQIVK